MSLSEAAKPVGDVIAAGITVGIITKLITAFAGILTIVWTLFRLWEMITGKPFVESKMAAWIRRDKK